MEAENQNTSESKDDADETCEDQTADGDSSATKTEDADVDKNKSEAGTSAQSTNSTAETSAERAPSKRNYRRRTGDVEDSSSEDDPEVIPTIENAGVNPPQAAASDSEDVSLDELRVSGSDGENNQNARR